MALGGARSLRVDDVEDFCTRWSCPNRPRAEGKEFCILYKGSTAIIRTLDPVTLGRGLLPSSRGWGSMSATTLCT
jgi:hypothetical protein